MEDYTYLINYLKKYPEFVYSIFYWKILNKRSIIVNKRQLLFIDTNETISINNELERQIAHEYLNNQKVIVSLVNLLRDTDSIDRISICFKISKRAPHYDSMRNDCQKISDYIKLYNENMLNQEIKKRLESIPNWEWDEYKFTVNGQRIVNFFSRIKKKPEILYKDDKLTFKYIKNLYENKQLIEKYRILYEHRFM